MSWPNKAGVPGETEAASGDGDRLQDGEGPAGDALRGVAGLLVSELCETTDPPTTQANYEAKIYQHIIPELGKIP